LASQPKKFRKNITVWQNGRKSDPQSTTHLDNIPLLLDTQCEESNWVAAKIVRDLGAHARILHKPIRRTDFNGHVMEALFVTTLDFKFMNGAQTFQADFLVSFAPVPFDMVLGDTDIERFGFLVEVNHVLGLAFLKQTKGNDASRTYSEIANSLTEQELEDKNNSMGQAKVAEDHDAMVRRQKEKNKQDRRRRGNDRRDKSEKHSGESLYR